MTQTIFEQIKASDANVYKYYLNGEWKISTSGKTVNILNPTTNETAFNVQGKSYDQTLTPQILL